MAGSIHPTAIIDSGCQLGKDVTIGPYVIIESNTILGDGTRVDPFAQIKNFTSLGKTNHIYSYSCLGEAPQDIKYQGQETWLKIGDNNKIREYATLNRGTPEGDGVTYIGSHCFLMAYTHVAHDCRLENGVIMANGATLGGHVHLGQKVVIGGLSAVHQFVHIGEFSFIGGKSGVAQDVPPYLLAAGERVKTYGPNIIGMRRAGFDRQQIKAVKKAFQILWDSGLSRQEAVSRAREQFAGFETVEKMISFIESSKRGIISREKQQESDG